MKQEKDRDWCWVFCPKCHALQKQESGEDVARVICDCPGDTPSVGYETCQGRIAIHKAGGGVFMDKIVSGVPVCQADYTYNRGNYKVPRNGCSSCLACYGNSKKIYNETVLEKYRI